MTSRTARCAFCLVIVLFCSGCESQRTAPSPRTSKPITIDNQTVQEVSFWSAALRRPTRYLVLLPATYDSEPSSKFPVLYLLHGAFGTPEDWVRNTHLSRYTADVQFIIVMPEGDNSYYVNAALKPEDRYEDYIVLDLARDVGSAYRTDSGKAAIAGVSMGGFGALNLGLKYPDRYFFVGSISNAADAPDRKFSIHKVGQSWRLRRTFGAQGSQTRQQASPFFIIRSISERDNLPLVYQACGRGDSLINVNRRLDRALTQANVEHVYKESDGAHDWGYWDRALKEMFEILKTPRK